MDEFSSLLLCMEINFIDNFLVFATGNWTISAGQRTRRVLNKVLIMSPKISIYHKCKLIKYQRMLGVHSTGYQITYSDFRFIYARSAQSTINICIEAHFHEWRWWWSTRIRIQSMIFFLLYFTFQWDFRINETQNLHNFQHNKDDTFHPLASVHFRRFIRSENYFRHRRDWEINSMHKKHCNAVDTMTINSHHQMDIEFSIFVLLLCLHLALNYMQQAAAGINYAQKYLENVFMDS